MKTILIKSISRMGGVTLAVFLALSMVAAAFPQPALAATTPCASNYVVKSGDTKNSIAHEFSLQWSQIATANKVLPTAELKVGSTLCIPKVPAATHGSMTATAVGKKLTVKMSGFNMRGIYNVRVKDASGKVAGFFMVGRITVPKNGSVTGIYSLPQELETTPTLKVCVISPASAMLCQVIKHKM